MTRSNAEVAKELGIHFTTVSRLRSGQRQPSLVLIQKIAGTYGASVDRLIKAKLKGDFADAFTRLVASPPRRPVRTP